MLYVCLCYIMKTRSYDLKALLCTRIVTPYTIRLIILTSFQLGRSRSKTNAKVERTSNFTGDSKRSVFLDVFDEQKVSL